MLRGFRTLRQDRYMGLVVPKKQPAGDENVFLHHKTTMGWTQIIEMAMALGLCSGIVTTVRHKDKKAQEPMNWGANLKRREDFLESPELADDPFAIFALCSRMEKP
mgnify:CR=1 FL=1